MVEAGGDGSVAIQIGPAADDAVVSHNTRFEAPDDGTAVRIEGSLDVEVSTNTVENAGIGIKLTGGSTALIAKNVIADDDEFDSDIAISCDGTSSARIRGNNTIAGYATEVDDGC